MTALRSHIATKRTSHGDSSSRATVIFVFPPELAEHAADLRELRGRAHLGRDLALLHAARAFVGLVRAFVGLVQAFVGLGGADEVPRGGTGVLESSFLWVVRGR
jgi:hypothetical protein